jgi:epoxyqueuosine reductase
MTGPDTSGPADPRRQERHSRMETAKRDIRDKALTLGFDIVGFAPAASGEDAKQRLAAYLSRGYHGDMGWMAETAERRADPKVLWPESRSVIVLGVNYGPEEDPLAVLEQVDRGAISVYARNRDYHDLLKKKLKALARWVAETFETSVKVFVDTAPVLEKHLAERAGIGWQGKHTNLVSRQYGSWLFLGEVFTALDIASDRPEPDHCGACRRCLDICPTDAFPEPYLLDARRCISYLTIEHKGPIPHALRAAIGNRIYGCDDCLAVCPWNKFARPTAEPGYVAREDLMAPELAALLRLEDGAFRQLFSRSPIKRIGRDRFVRNVLIAVGNSGDGSLASDVEGLLRDASPLVRGAAVWALWRLLDRDRLKAVAAIYQTVETDPQVREEWRLVLDAGKAHEGDPLRLE